MESERWDPMSVSWNCMPVKVQVGRDWTGERLEMGGRNPAGRAGRNGTALLFPFSSFCPLPKVCLFTFFLSNGPTYLLNQDGGRWKVSCHCGKEGTLTIPMRVHLAGTAGRHRCGRQVLCLEGKHHLVCGKRVADSGWKVQADKKVPWVRTANLPSLPSRKEFKLISTVAAPSFFKVEANVSQKIRTETEPLTVIPSMFCGWECPAESGAWG